MTAEPPMSGAKRRRAILWESPYGGVRVRGSAPDRAYHKALALAEAVTDLAGFGSADLNIYAWPSGSLASWARAQEPWTTLPAERAAAGIPAPHPALLPAIAAYGAPYCHVHESDDGRAYLRLSWQVSADEDDFEARVEAWRALAVAHADEAPFEDDLPSVTAYFNFSEDAQLTVAGSDEVLPHQDEAAWPEGCELGLQGFASVPDGNLLLVLGLPFTATGADFVAFDRGLVRVLGKFPESRYRLVTPGGARRKLTWRRRR